MVYATERAKEYVRSWIELAREEVSLVGLDVVDREKKIEAIQRRWIALVKNGLV